MGGRTALVRTVEHYSLLNEAGATADGTEVNVEETGILAVHLIAASSWDGTIDFEGSIETDQWASLQGENAGSGALVVSATGATLNDIFRFDVSGFKRFRTRVSGRSTGNITSRVRGVPV